MEMITSISLGFVTNSSSAVYHIPRQIMEHPEVQAFLKVWDIRDGVMPEDLWYRTSCTTIAMTPEQKRQVRDKFHEDGYEEYHAPGIDTEDDSTLVIFGDEHASIAKALVNLIRWTLDIDLIGTEYN